MKRALTFLILTVLLPFNAYAVVCKQVNYTYGSNLEDNAGQISASGWARVYAFSPPVGGTTGWFRFNDGTVIYGMHNGTLGTIQWHLYPNTIRPASDCTATLPAPLGGSGGGGGGGGDEGGDLPEDEGDEYDPPEDPPSDDCSNCAEEVQDPDTERWYRWDEDEGLWVEISGPGGHRLENDDQDAGSD